MVKSDPKTLICDTELLSKLFIEGYDSNFQTSRNNTFN